MVELVPMTAEQFDDYLAFNIPMYANEKVKAGNWKEEEALDKSRETFTHLLPNGVASPDNYLFNIVAEGQKVGWIWVAIRDFEGGFMAFVYDVLVFEEHRRKGYAYEAFQALEDVVRAKGAEKIGLHVFGYNTSAQALYLKLGYEITNVNMAKQLS